VSVAGLLLGDSRFPAGGHAHSGGVEPAVTAGTVTDLGSLELFLRGRLRTAGLVAAAVAAAACAHVRAAGGDRVAPGEQAAAGGQAANGERVAVREPAAPVLDDYWNRLDGEADARTPSPAQREASRRQGRALLRAARVAWPDAPWFAELAASVKAGATPADGAGRREYRGGPHHAVVLGAAAAAAGCEPREAARIAAYQAAAGPVSAAVRLLALDPMRATGVLARLAADIEQIAEQGAGYARRPADDLPGPSAPALDLLAEAHIRTEVRLFES
jgi:urease accessory protein